MRDVFGAVDASNALKDGIVLGLRVELSSLLSIFRRWVVEQREMRALTDIHTSYRIYTHFASHTWRKTWANMGMVHERHLEILLR